MGLCAFRPFKIKNETDSKFLFIIVSNKIKQIVKVK